MVDISELQREIRDLKDRLMMLEACPYMKSLRELGWQPPVEEPTGTDISQLTEVPRPDLEIEPIGVEKSQSLEDRIKIIEDDKIRPDTWRKHCLRLTDSQLRVNALIRELRKVGIITDEMLININQNQKKKGLGLDFSRLDETKIAKKESREDPRTVTNVDAHEIVHVIDLIFRCRCDKVPVLMLVPVGHGEMLWVCPDCNEEYGRWKPPWLREPHADRRPSESAYSRAKSLVEEQSERFIFHMPKEDMSVMERYHGEEWTLVAHEHGIDLLCNDREFAIAFYEKEPELGPCDCDPCIGQSLGVDCEKCLQIIQSVSSKSVSGPSEKPMKGSWSGEYYLGKRIGWICSECETKVKLRENRCPYCGADMREISAEEPKKGEWIVGRSRGYNCSICGCLVVTDKDSKCPDCGADMKGKISNTEG